MADLQTRINLAAKYSRFIQSDQMLDMVQALNERREYLLATLDNHTIPFDGGTVVLFDKSGKAIARAKLGSPAFCDATVAGNRAEATIRTTYDSVFVPGADPTGGEARIFSRHGVELMRADVLTSVPIEQGQPFTLTYSATATLAQRSPPEEKP